ncbi:hypothetical protein HMI54_012946, partial [Coelomomyces lativittatus]
MGKTLYHANSTFKHWMDNIDSIITTIIRTSLPSHNPHQTTSIIEYLFPRNANINHNIQGKKEHEESANRLILTQCAIFAIEYSLCKMWMEQYGVVPSIMIGH